VELYNLGNDLSETRNLANQETVMRRELSTLLSDHLKETNAGMPVYKRSRKPVPYPIEIE